MAVQIVFTRDDGREGTIAVDATASEKHESTATPTERTVEEGAPTSDHVIQDHDRLQLRVWVSNTPVRPGSLGSEQQLTLEIEQMADPVGARFVANVAGQIANELQSRVTAPVGGFEDRLDKQRIPQPRTVGLTTVQFGGEFDRVRLVYDTLRALKERAKRLRVLTSLREYERMVIESLGAPVQDTSDAVRFDLSLKQIRTAAAEVVAAPEPAEPRGEPQRSRGQQDAEDATQQGDLDWGSYEEDSSTAKDLFG